MALGPAPGPDPRPRAAGCGPGPRGPVQVEFDLEPDERKGGMRAANVTGPDGAAVKGAPRRDSYDDDGDGYW